MTQTSYTINTTDEDGRTNIDISVGNRTYNQDVLLPTDKNNATKKLDDYVTDYVKNLVDQSKAETTPEVVSTPLQALVGVEQTVTLDKATSDYVDANFIEVVPTAEVVPEVV